MPIVVQPSYQYQPLMFRLPAGKPHAANHEEVRCRHDLVAERQGGQTRSEQLVHSVPVVPRLLYQYQLLRFHSRV